MYHLHILITLQDRLSLERKIMNLNITDKVFFHNRFVDLQELTENTSCRDMYETPHLAEEQMTSGALACAVRMGKAAVSTPYPNYEYLGLEECA
jgi:hypothetical protein